VGALLNNLGNLMLDARRLKEAAMYMAEAVSTLEAAYGPNHTQTARAVFNLGCLHAAEGDHARAASTFRRALDIYTAMLGAASPVTNHVRLAYAAELKRGGERDEARRVQREAERARVESGPAPTDWTVDYRELMMLRKRD
jgi:Tfp pilus assembly protein PilF